MPIMGEQTQKCVQYFGKWWRGKKTGTILREQHCEHIQCPSHSYFALAVTPRASDKLKKAHTPNICYIRISIIIYVNKNEVFLYSVYRRNGNACSCSYTQHTRYKSNKQWTASKGITQRQRKAKKSNNNHSSSSRIKSKIKKKTGRNI